MQSETVKIKIPKVLEMPIGLINNVKTLNKLGDDLIKIKISEFLEMQ